MKFEAGQQQLRDWFDGFSMLQSFTFRGGAVAYANRFLRSRAYTHATEREKIGLKDACARLALE
ncbi:MAG: carotenoid oxygenase family protein, partial [Balneolaceae bacterium]